MNDFFLDPTRALADFASAYNQANRLLRLRLAANAGIAPDALLPATGYYKDDGGNDTGLLKFRLL